MGLYYFVCLRTREPLYLENAPTHPFRTTFHQNWVEAFRQPRN